LPGNPKHDRSAVVELAVLAAALATLVLSIAIAVSSALPSGDTPGRPAAPTSLQAATGARAGN